MTTPNLSRKRRVRVISPSSDSHVLSRPLVVPRLNTEVLLYAGLVVLSLLMHLWALGDKAMHHDESLHAWFSWKFFMGRGGFNCANGSVADTYCYNPVYHGPTLYLLTYVAYFLFGVSEAAARLPMALAGIGLVASCWWLRPLMGRRAALLVALGLVLSPSILYFTRFARHDALALLWTLWLMIGLFRYMREARGRWLYLAAAATALLWATHELVFIIIFVVLSFLIQRWLWERLSNRTFIIVSGVVMLLAGLLVLFNPGINLPTASGQAANVLHVGGFGLIGFATLLIGQIISLRWGNIPLVRGSLGPLLRAEASVLLRAFAVFAAVFVVFFSSFFTYPLGILGGIYEGIAYWLGTQQTYARGGQPWYYYFMLLGIYEILPVLLMLLGLGGWLARVGWRRAIVSSSLWDESPPDASADLGEAEAIDGDSVIVAPLNDEPPLVPEQPAAEPETVNHLWVGFGFYWFLLALVVFSWAGEKMPWLVIHMALPAIIGGAWALDRVLDRIDWFATRRDWGWLVLPLALGATLLLLMTLARLGQSGADLAAQQAKLSTLMLVLFALVLVGGVVALAVSRQLSRSTVLGLTTLAVVGVLALYSLRASVLAAYTHPDTPIELLVYTQTAPDVPIIVQQAQELAVTQTRNNRSVDDPVGGHSMKILLSSGDSATGNSEGSLRWPLEWYFRDWTNVQWRDKAQIANLSAADLDAPMAIFARSNMAPDTEQVMRDAGYVPTFTTAFNWWFPEYGSDGTSGYKDRLWDPAYGCDAAVRGQKDVNGRDASNCAAGGALILTWPFRPSNWTTLFNYMIKRELPEGATIGSREMVVFVRSDLAPQPGSGSVAGGGGTNTPLKLVAETTLAGEQLNNPRDVAVGPDGSVYVADATTNRIVIYAADGTARSLQPTGDGALLEPSGVAVDAQGNLYVADTWHARIAKFGPDGTFLTAWGTGDEFLDEAAGKVLSRTGGTAEGNAAKPLGFFGPRDVAVDPAGNVYIADTGNKRIVVTDSEGNFRGQIGTAGAGPGQFNEPIGIAVDAGGNLFVGDSWNGRVQVFAIAPDGLPSPTPKSTWRVAGWDADTYLDPYLAANADGQVVVTIPSRNVATLYDITGRALLTWGGEGVDDASLSAPSGVAFGSDGTVYIAEKGTQRVQEWRLPRLR